MKSIVLPDNSEALFYYKAVDRAGKTVTGDVLAVGRKEAIEKLHAQGLVPIQISPKKTWLFWRRDKRLSGQEAMLFSEELAVLLESGLPLEESLKMLATSFQGKLLEKTLFLQEAVRSGRTLAEAMKDSHAFTGFFVSTVEAGERTGHLAHTFSSLAQAQGRMEALKSDLRSILIYPLILAFAAFAVLCFILTYVIPQFEQMFAEMQAVLPWPTLVVLSLSHFLSRWGWIFLLFFVSLYFWGRYFLRDEAKRIQLERWLLKKPFIGSLWQRIEAARFARMAATLLASGVALLETIELAAQASTMKAVRQSLLAAREKVKDGKSLVEALGTEAIFPDLALTMLKVGENTGALESMLQKVAALFEKESERFLKRLITLLEPVLILGLGVIIGIIMMSIVSALMGMNRLV